MSCWSCSFATPTWRRRPWQKCGPLWRQRPCRVQKVDNNSGAASFVIGCSKSTVPTRPSLTRGARVAQQRPQGRRGGGRSNQTYYVWGRNYEYTVNIIIGVIGVMVVFVIFVIIVIIGIRRRQQRQHPFSVAGVDDDTRMGALQPRVYAVSIGCVARRRVLRGARPGPPRRRWQPSRLPSVFLSPGCPLSRPPAVVAEALAWHRYPTGPLRSEPAAWNGHFFAGVSVSRRSRPSPARSSVCRRRFDSCRSTSWPKCSPRCACYSLHVMTIWWSAMGCFCATRSFHARGRALRWR